MIFYSHTAERDFPTRRHSNEFGMFQILGMLKRKLGFNEYSDEFYDSIREIYGVDVQFIQEPASYKSIYSIEVPNEIYTMLLLMYSNNI
jgi:hypothetical protein